MANEDATKAVNSYITDMLALEKHIQKALTGQIEDLDEEDPGFVTEIRRINTTVEQHINTLEALAERRQDGGQKLSDAVKRAASNVLGVGAAAVDFVRNEKLPKNLRDDYTALSLASIGYVMLYTTATSLGESEVANMAKAHLENHAKNTMVLHALIPGAVIRFLQRDGLPAQTEQLAQINKTVASVWEGEPGIITDDASVRRSATADAPSWKRGSDAELR
jgi:ferritin-like metal-binding protein YciE